MRNPLGINQQILEILHMRREYIKSVNKETHIKMAFLLIPERRWPVIQYNSVAAPSI